METVLNILGKIGFDWPVALANFIAVLIIYAILAKFAFGPIRSNLEARRKKIEQGVEDAQKAETELVMAKEERNKVVGAGRTEANKIIEQAHSEESKIIAGAKDRGEQEAKRIIEEGEKTIEKDRAHMEGELKSRAADLVVAGVESVLREKLTADKDRAFIDSIVK